MQINLETLLVALAFIVPGFLTTRLIESRTPVLKRETSVFVETSVSLLRSVYINIIIGILFLPELWIFLALGRLVLDLPWENPLSIATEHPFIAIFLLIFWISAALILAIIFGFFWDPIDFLDGQLSAKSGIELNDPFQRLISEVKSYRKGGDPKSQVWLQARLKDGSIYQGEFDFVSWRSKEENREVFLRNVRYFPAAVSSEEISNTEPFELFYGAYINTMNCQSIDIILTKGDTEEA
jgi:hypothetical protein